MPNFTNDEDLIQIAKKRLENNNLANAIPAEDVYKELGIDPADLSDFDDVEIE